MEYRLPCWDTSTLTSQSSLAKLSAALSNRALAQSQRREFKVGWHISTRPVELGAFIRHRMGQYVEFRQAGQKKRRARQPHKRLLHYFNVNRTSPDHLPLGGGGDVDKSVEWPKYSAGSGEMAEQAFPRPWSLGTRKPVTRNTLITNRRE
jgi:hypothetical protein